MTDKKGTPRVMLHATEDIEPGLAVWGPDANVIWSAP